MLRYWLLALLFYLGTFTPLQARTYDDIVASGQITIAVYRDFPPYSFLSQSGEPQGLDVWLASLIAEQMGLKLKLLWMTAGERSDDDLRNYLWKGLNLTSDDGRRLKADVMLRVPYDREWQLMRDDVGELAHGQVYMFAPYQTEQWKVAFDPGKIAQIETLALFQYEPIGVVEDSLPQFYFTSASDRFRQQTHTYPNLQLAFSGLITKKLTAIMGMGGQIDWLIHTQANTTQASTNPAIQSSDRLYPMLGKPKWEIGIAVHESNRQLAYVLEDITSNAVTSGQIAHWATSLGMHWQAPEQYRDLATPANAAEQTTPPK